jgi:hypothetical protein
MTGSTLPGIQRPNRTSPLQRAGAAAVANTSRYNPLNHGLESRGETSGTRQSASNANEVIDQNMEDLISKTCKNLQTFKETLTKLLRMKTQQPVSNHEKIDAAIKKTEQASKNVITALYETESMRYFKTNFPEQFLKANSKIKETLPDIAQLVDKLSKEVPPLISESKKERSGSNEGASAQSTPPAPTTTQRSDSSDSSEDKKTPPNTPARPTAKPIPTNGIGGGASDADIEFSASDIALLKKITNGGTLKSLSKTYIGDMDPDENINTLNRFIDKAIELMGKIDNTKPSKNNELSLNVAYNFSQALDTDRRFFSYFDFSQPFSENSKFFIKTRLEMLGKHINMIKSFLDSKLNSLPKANMNMLINEINEFKHVVNEVNSRVFNIKTPVYTNLPSLEQTDSAAVANTSSPTESKKADLIPNFEGPLGNIYKYAAPLLAQSTNLYWQIKNALEGKTPGLPKPTPSQISQYEENIKNLILRSSTILEKTFNLKTQARIDQPDISATEKRKLFDALYKLLIDDKNLIDKLRTYLRTPIITPPAPTTTQRSESSSDSSEDEKTPPNTPATTKQSSSALPQFTTADILLAKILSNGTLNSLSTTYEICFGPVEFMKKNADKMEALAETMESFSKTKSESYAIKLATLHSEMFYIYRKFFSNYNYSNKLNSDDKTYISNGIKELKDHLIKVETFLRVAANILPIDYKNTLTEELNEFKHTVNEVNSRVFNNKTPVYTNLPSLEQTDSAAVANASRYDSASAAESNGESRKQEINHIQPNNPDNLVLGEIAMKYLKTIIEQLKLKSKSQDPQKEYIATLNLAFSNNRWQNIRGQDQRELNKIPAILKTVTGNNPAVNLQINTLFEQYGLVKINDQTPIIPPAPTTT